MPYAQEEWGELFAKFKTGFLGREIDDVTWDPDNGVISLVFAVGGASIPVALDWKSLYNACQAVP